MGKPTYQSNLNTASVPAAIWRASHDREGLGFSVPPLLHFPRLRLAQDAISRRGSAISWEHVAVHYYATVTQPRANIMFNNLPK